MAAPVVFSSGFKVAFVATWKVSCGELQDCFTRCTNLSCLNWSRNVSKFYAWQVVSLMNEHGKSKFVAKADALSTIRNKLITQGGKLETSAKLWVLVSNISSPRLKRRFTRFFFFLYFAAFRTARSHSFFFAVHVGVLHVFKEIWRWFQ